MMGAALGGLLGHVLPGTSPAVFALVGMAGSLGGVTRSPFTAIVSAFELTHDANALLALLVAATIAHLVSVLVLKRSILTEKVARRGFHVMREYAVDPLEATFVREVMETNLLTVEPGLCLSDLYRSLPEGSPERRQRLYPVVSASGRLVGVLPWSAVLAGRDDSQVTVGDVMNTSFTVAHPDEILRGVAERMASMGIGTVPVVDRADAARLDGMVSQFDLLAARQKLLEEERHAERVLTLRRVKPAAPPPAAPPPDEPGPAAAQRAVAHAAAARAGDRAGGRGGRGGRAGRRRLRR
jgi:chloride channel protein, CIC family